ncbi:menaquinone-dependent protoporphyrinogen oxidase [Streptomyces sp. B4I13]|uniref:flavodoxin domain-containing protein n=1 Tax=Streptomyces sp. B4I13 TaxID=3042271 RepID=UPI002781BBE4|nr:flavodoxin domain-containing protein [Streptomyces sp. B4I13]MDQ0958143.1 menaquinone-dependent protoporphyrinogen oxidase [Streptomyces sp. B4I13]
MNVLVGYATAHGSTREIAERLAVKLSEAGLKAEARDMETVDDADAYGAFVLGSAVHGQAWLDAAKDFVRDNGDILGLRPVWIFSVGMPGALRGPLKRMVPKEVPAIIESLPGDLSYRSHRLFSGVVARDQLPRTGRILFHLMGGRFGDYRDWDAIDAWASEMADELARG